MSGVGGRIFFRWKKSVNTTTIFIFRGKNYANCRNLPRIAAQKKFALKLISSINVNVFF